MNAFQRKIHHCLQVQSQHKFKHSNKLFVRNTDCILKRDLELHLFDEIFNVRGLFCSQISDSLLLLATRRNILLQHDPVFNGTYSQTGICLH